MTLTSLSDCNGRKEEGGSFTYVAIRLMLTITDKHGLTSHLEREEKTTKKEHM
jgi:hypothetical protein